MMNALCHNGLPTMAPFTMTRNVCPALTIRFSAPTPWLNRSGRAWLTRLAAELTQARPKWMILLALVLPVGLIGTPPAHATQPRPTVVSAAPSDPFVATVPGQGSAQKKKKAKTRTGKTPSAAQQGASGESTAQRDARLKRECKGRPNAGACLGYAGP
jgi:hypothetical protein